MKKEQRWEDPIVAEVHRIRAGIAKEHHHDLHAYLADIVTHQAGTVTGEELRAVKYAPTKAQPALVWETPPRQRKPR